MVELNNKYSQAEIDEYKKQRRIFFIIRAARLKQKQQRQQPQNGPPQQPHQPGCNGPKKRRSRKRHPKNNQLQQQPQSPGNDGPGKGPSKRIPPKNDSFVYEADAEMEVFGLDEPHSRLQTWDEMKLNNQLLENIKNCCGYIKPRKVQEVVIPYIMDGFNIKCQSETGTGKTAAYLIPIIDNLIKENAKNGLPTDGPICLIIAPTRELVSQIYEDAKILTENTDLKVVKVFGGTRTALSRQDLEEGCHILCATLGRLLSLMKDWHTFMAYLKYIVIDEADKFFVEGQPQEILTFFRHETFPSIENRQTLFFSPTLRLKDLEKVADQYSDNKNRIVIKSVADSNQRITYLVESIPTGTSKVNFLINYLKSIITKNNGECPKILIFTNTKKDADLIADNLVAAELPATGSHSGYNQEYRSDTLYDFKVGEENARILVSINVCGRGIDVYEMNYVINYDYPHSKWQFIQRCGRTGRTQPGTAITFCIEPVPNGIASSIREVIEAAGQEAPEYLHPNSVMAGLEKYMGNLDLKKDGKK